MTATADASIASRPAPEAIPAPLAPGGTDPDRFDCAEAWYPVHYVEDLDPARPTRFTLLGQDLVIWWEPQGAMFISGVWREIKKGRILLN